MGVAAIGAGVAASAAFGAKSAGAAPGGGTPGTAVILGLDSDESAGANTASATTNISTTGGNGINGYTTSSAKDSCGLYGNSENGIGVYGTVLNGPSGLLGAEFAGAPNPATAGAVGDNSQGVGVLGLSSDNNGVEGIAAKTGTSGVYGFDQSPDKGFGVTGYSQNGTGAQSVTNATIAGQSGVSGIDNSAPGGQAVYGESTNGIGMYGISSAASTLLGTVAGGIANPCLAGLFGDSDTNVGVVGLSGANSGVQGSRSATNQSGGNCSGPRSSAKHMTMGAPPPEGRPSAQAAT
jgi:hypothetical protein